MTSRRNRVLAVVLAIAAAQGLAFAVFRWVESSRARVAEPFRYERVSHVASDLMLLRADGSSLRVSDFRGKPVLLHFWATWCPPCKKELPGLLDFGRELERSEGLRLIAVALDDDWSKIRDFFGGEIPPEIVRASSDSVAKHYEVSNLPDTYLLGADGVARIRVGGARDWRTEAARRAIGAQLRRPLAPTPRP